MRRLLALLASIFISFSAHSAGQSGGTYAGIWQSTATGSYVLVSQNGNFLIVTTYINIPAQNIFVPFNNGQNFRISGLDVGDLISGSLVDNTAVMSGIAAFRACNVTIAAIFTSSTTMFTQFLASTPTAEGAAQGINCAQIRDNEIASIGLAQGYAKIF